MLTSQLPRIHDGAAAWLRRLYAGKAAPKDLEGWCAHYATTFGAKDMNPPAWAALVEERVLVITLEGEGGQRDHLVGWA